MNSLVRALTSDLDYFTSLFPTAGMPVRTNGGAYHTAWVPPANVSESEKGYMIELAAPGFSRDDFQISAEDGRLTISVGARENTSREKYLLQEFGYTREFTRSWSLPSTVDAGTITARYEAGVLSVDVPTGKKKSKVAVRVD
jgi:HSP20 family protein